MQAEAAAAKSSGVVGVTVKVKNHVWGEHATEFLATGTAVRRLADQHRLPETFPKPTFTLGLDRSRTWWPVKSACRMRKQPLSCPVPAGREPARRRWCSRDRCGLDGPARGGPQIATGGGSDQADAEGDHPDGALARPWP